MPNLILCSVKRRNTSNTIRMDRLSIGIRRRTSQSRNILRINFTATTNRSGAAIGMNYLAGDTIVAIPMRSTRFVLERKEEDWRSRKSSN